ncbi:unnamed protein product [Psylliodes chrysocephalus]|uniref:Uncharacterized protein n=1 Tax=Psylliodes chrysocephalus TaxID=3402493 RepID=A0A9P0G8F6_9CUCU|nr:unnamed protein product [Psylliodes chrysocephala]
MAPTGAKPKNLDVKPKEPEDEETPSSYSPSSPRRQQKKKTNNKKEEKPAEEIITEAMAIDLPNSEDEFTEVISRSTRKRGRKSASGAGNISSSEEDDTNGNSLTPRNGSKNCRGKSPAFSPPRDEIFSVKNTEHLGASKGLNRPVNGRASEACKSTIFETVKATATKPKNDDFPPLPKVTKIPIMRNTTIKTKVPPTHAPGGTEPAKATANLVITGRDETLNPTAEPKQTKVPPVVVESGAKNWPEIRRGLVERGIPFTKAPTRNEELKVWPATFDAYRATTKYLDERKAKYHTYRLEDEKFHKAKKFVVIPLTVDDDVVIVVESQRTVSRAVQPLQRGFGGSTAMKPVIRMMDVRP